MAWTGQPAAHELLTCWTVCLVVSACVSSVSSVWRLSSSVSAAVLTGRLSVSVFVLKKNNNHLHPWLLVICVIFSFLSLIGWNSCRDLRLVRVCWVVLGISAILERPNDLRSFVISRLPFVCNYHSSNQRHRVENVLTVTSKQICSKSIRKCWFYFSI